jgi:hypothetical protein
MNILKIPTLFGSQAIKARMWEKLLVFMKYSKIIIFTYQIRFKSAWIELRAYIRWPIV